MAHVGRPAVFSDDQIKAIIARLHEAGINPSYPALRRANPECHPHTNRFKKLRDQWYAETGKAPIVTERTKHRKTVLFHEALAELEGIEGVEERAKAVRAITLRTESEAYNQSYDVRARRVGLSRRAKHG